MDKLQLLNDHQLPFAKVLGLKFVAASGVGCRFRQLLHDQRTGGLDRRPVLLDAEGQLFGAPAIVLWYLQGRPVFPRQNIEQWIRGLATAVFSVHGVTPDRVDLSARGIRCGNHPDGHRPAMLAGQTFRHGLKKGGEP